MKPLVILLTVIICGLSSLAKGNDNPQVDYPHDISTPSYIPSSVETVAPYALSESFDYKKTNEWKKFKTLRACGWSALGLGIPVTLFGVGLSVFADSQNGNGGGAGVPFIISGGVITLASIPLLISAYHYRNKAKNLGLGISIVSTPGYQPYVSYTPAFSLSLFF